VPQREGQIEALVRQALCVRAGADSPLARLRSACALHKGIPCVPTIGVVLTSGVRSILKKAGFGRAWSRLKIALCPPAPPFTRTSSTLLIKAAAIFMAGALTRLPNRGTRYCG